MTDPSTTTSTPSTSSSAAATTTTTKRTGGMLDESITLLEDGMAPSTHNQAAAAKNIDDDGADAPLAASGKEEGEMMNPQAEGEGNWYQSKTCLVHPLLILVQFIFSGYHVLTSSALKTKGVDPLVFALYRELSASILIALYAYWAILKGGHNWRLAKEHVPRFLLMGLFSAGNVLGAVQALTLITATNFAVLQPSIPVFTMMLSVLFRMEKMTCLKSLGLLAAVAGAVVVEVVRPDTGNFSKGSQSDFIYGNVVVILQCLAMGSLLVAQKVVLDVYHPTVVTAWYYSIGSVLTLIICVCKNLPASAYELSHDYRPWLALGYAAAFGTAFNYNAYSYAGTVVAPGVISIYSTLQPLGTAVLSFIFLHSKATTGEIVGGILVMIGLVLTVAARDIESKWAKKKEEKARLDAEINNENGEGGGAPPSAGSPKSYGTHTHTHTSSRKDSKSVPLVGAEEDENGGASL